VFIGEIAASALRGSRQRAAQREYEGLVLFAGQKPYPTWRQALPPPDDPPCEPPAKEPVAATSTGVAPKPRRSLVLPIVLGIGFAVVAVGLVGFLVTLTSRPAPPPKTAAGALPALEAAPPPLTAASNPPDQTIGPEERLARLEPPPIQIGVPQEDNLEIVPPPDSGSLVELAPSPPRAVPPMVLAPLPPSRPLELAPPLNPPTSYDQSTAIYDISAHTVYLPNGMRLEAHSGLGDRIDDPRFVDERDHGATPPGVYQLTLRESLFHGVQALRLNPIGGGFTFNRVGLLAHPYMLGPNGDSNGCVSFKTYDVFLRAFQSGGVKRLAVVARWTGGPRQVGAFASLSQALNR
jgi:type VI secretion system (T6SS) effector TldE1-like protein